MSQIIWVLPNVSEFNKNGRGSLYKRLVEAKKLGFDLIEIPADFIKNKTEIKITGLNIGDFLTKEAISRLYNKANVDTNALNYKYILHTDPQLRRKIDSRSVQPKPLQWYNKTWLEKFIEMLNNIIEYFEAPPYAIEIHPGTKPNKIEDVANAMCILSNEFSNTFILLENRTKQIISNAKQINTLWNLLTEISNPKKFGVILDVQQLFTTCRNLESFIKNFQNLNIEALKGVHIHSNHKCPNLTDRIPWQKVFEFLSKVIKKKQLFLINPEVHHKNHILETKKFIEKMIS